MSPVGLRIGVLAVLFLFAAACSPGVDTAPSSTPGTDRITTTTITTTSTTTTRPSPEATTTTLQNTSTAPPSSEVAPPGTDSGSIDAMTSPDDTTSVSTPGPESATSLVATPGCSEEEPGRTLATLEWISAQEGEQRVDFTFTFLGFESGDFVSTPDLPTKQNGYLLLDPEPGIQYGWRVVTKIEGQWIPSEISTFRVSPCILDSP